MKIAFSNHLAERSLALHSSQNSLVYSSRCLLSLDSPKFPVRNKARRMGDSHSTSTMLLTETTVPLEALLTRTYWTWAGKHFADMLLKFWLFWLRCDWSSMLLWFLVKQRQIPLIAIFYLGKTRKDWMIREILLTNLLLKINICLRGQHAWQENNNNNTVLITKVGLGSSGRFAVSSLMQEW